MECSQNIAAGLAGEPAVVARRGALLTAFLTTLTDTGVERAVAVLDQPLAELEDAFIARLAELEALL